MNTRIKRDTNSPRDQPREIKSDFYSIVPREDGLCDVYLIPSGTVYQIKDGFHEYDVDCHAVKGVEFYDGLEADIRERYASWLESAAPIND